MTTEPTPLVTVLPCEADIAAAKACWNALADAGNDWHALSVDEQMALLDAFARHAANVRLAALEAAARYVEGAGGVIPGASVFAPLVSGNNMPCMSGDARDRLHPHKRREFDEATRNLATAIRALSNKGGRNGE